MKASFRVESSTMQAKVVKLQAGVKYAEEDFPGSRVRLLMDVRVHWGLNYIFRLSLNSVP